MTTAYTSLLGLSLPVQGELVGTWGDVTNTSLTNLLDTAIAGATTLGTDADVTLTSTVGLANQARAAILYCSGARTALRNITAPASSKIYTVINATTGGFSVVLRGTGPTTGITVLAGTVAQVAWNGTDFVLVGTALYNNAALTGTPTAPTAAVGTNTTQIATTAFVKAAIAGPVATTQATVSAGTYNIDLSLNTIFDLTLNVSTVFTFTNPPATGNLKSVTLILRQGAGGGKTASWTSGKYTDGVAPVLSTGAGQIDMMSFFTVDGGTTYFGMFAMANVS